jgi:hypothetical protein
LQMNMGCADGNDGCICFYRGLKPVATMLAEPTAF